MDENSAFSPHARSGLILCVISIGLVVFFFKRFLFRDDMLLGLAATDFVLGTLWWGWTQIPQYFRKTVHRWLRRRGLDDKVK